MRWRGRGEGRGERGQRRGEGGERGGERESREGGGLNQGVTGYNPHTVGCVIVMSLIVALWEHTQHRSMALQRMLFTTTQH